MLDHRAAIQDAGQLIVRGQLLDALERLLQLGLLLRESGPQSPEAPRQHRHAEGHDTREDKVDQLDLNGIALRIGARLVKDRTGQQQEAQPPHRTGLALVQGEHAEQQDDQHDRQHRPARRAGDRVGPGDRDKRESNLHRLSLIHI